MKGRVRDVFLMLLDGLRRNHLFTIEEDVGDIPGDFHAVIGYVGGITQQQIDISVSRVSLTQYANHTNQRPCFLFYDDGAEKFLSLKEMFASDFPDQMTVHGTIEMRYVGRLIVVESQLHYDVQANGKFMSFYIPANSVPFDVAKTIALEIDDYVERLRNINTSARSLADTTRTESDRMRFTGRAFVYHEDNLSAREIADLVEIYTERSLALQLRGHDYHGTKLLTGER